MTEEIRLDRGDWNDSSTNTEFKREETKMGCFRFSGSEMPTSLTDVNPRLQEVRSKIQTSWLWAARYKWKKPHEGGNRRRAGSKGQKTETW